MAIINVPYTGGVAPITITEMWAAGMRSTEVHRSTDWDGQSGNFTEYTNNGGGARPDLVQDQEGYTFTDSDGDSGYAYKVRHRSAAGKVTDFSDIITVGDGAVVMSAQQVWARYVHPDGYVGTWIKKDSRAVRLTLAAMDGDKGNKPYVPGTDWTIEIALMFQDSDGVWHGVDLTGVTEIVLTFTPKTGTAFTRKLSVGGEITVMDQAIDYPTGSRGRFRAIYANTDSIAVGSYDADCDVTFSGGKIVEEFYGLFESVD